MNIHEYLVIATYAVGQGIRNLQSIVLNLSIDT